MSDKVGPPEKGPVVKVRGKGVSVIIRLESEIDYEILHHALEMAERRRYGK